MTDKILPEIRKITVDKPYKIGMYIAVSFTVCMIIVSIIMFFLLVWISTLGPRVS